MEQYASILTYIICVAISSILYKFRHLLGMIFTIFFVSSLLWGAAMTTQMLKGPLSIQDYIKEVFMNMTQQIIVN